MKAGDAVAIRTTGEPCTVLKVATLPEGDAQRLEGLSNVVVTVRRPVETKNGIDHVANSFYIEELELDEERKARQYKEFIGLSAQAKSAATEATDEALKVPFDVN